MARGAARATSWSLWFWNAGLVACAQRGLLILDKFQATAFQGRIGAVLRQAPASEPACGNSSIQARVIPAPVAPAPVVPSALSRRSENGPVGRLNHSRYAARSPSRERERERDREREREKERRQRKKLTNKQDSNHGFAHTNTHAHLSSCSSSATHICAGRCRHAGMIYIYIYI